jgi:DNA polymerase (family 10)
VAPKVTGWWEEFSTQLSALGPSIVPVHNADIAAIFEEIADLLEIKGDNPFRIRAYRNAARTLRDMNRDVSAMVQQGED